MVETPQKKDISQEADKASHAVAPKKTRGEKLFDMSVYGGINGVVNFLVTIPFAYWLLRGEGTKHMDRAAEKLKDVGVKNPRWITEMLGTSLGGWAMVVPVYVAEHYRKPLVNWFNQKFGSEQDKQAEIVHPPKQTWGSLLKGRLGAMATVTVGFGAANALFSKQFRAFENGVAEKLCKVFRKDAVNASGGHTKAYHLGQMAALDVFATASSATLMYIFSKTFAKKREANKGHVAASAAISAPAAVASDPFVVANADMPSKTVAGEKIHPGVIAQDPALQAQL